jgi:hypothetical protein
VTIVAAGLAKGQSEADLLDAAKTAEELVTMIQTGKHVGDGKVRRI